MRILSLVVCFSISASIAAALPAKLSQPVRRAVAQQVSSLLAMNGLQPTSDNAHLSQVEQQQRAEGMRAELDAALATNTAVVSGFLKLLLDENKPRHDAEELGERVQVLAAETLKTYTLAQTLGWQLHEEIDVEKAKRRLAKTLIHTYNAFHEKSKQGGDASLLTLYDKLSRHYETAAASAELKQSIDDAAEFYHAFPQLDIKLDDGEIDFMLAYARAGDRTWTDISDKLTLALFKAANTIPMDKKVKITDIFASVFSSDRMSELAIDDLSEFNLTFAQLQDGRFAVATTAKLLIKMGWSWREFGAIVYPNDTQQASLLVSDYPKYAAGNKKILVDIQRALQTQIAEQDTEKKAAIERFVAELPQLFTKELVLKTLRYAKRNNNLTPNVSMRKLFDKVIENHLTSTNRWQYLSITNLLDYSLKLTTLSLKRDLRLLGMNNKQLSEKLFGTRVLNKMLNDETFDEQDINTVRMKLNPEKIEAIVKNFKVTDDIRDTIVFAVKSLPQFMQIEMFVKEFVYGLFSNQDLVEELENTRADSMNKPLADKILNVSAKMDNVDRALFLNGIRQTIFAIHEQLYEDALRDKYMYSGH